MPLLTQIGNKIAHRVNGRGGKKGIRYKKHGGNIIGNRVQKMIY